MVELSRDQRQFLKKLSSPWRYRIYFLSKVPSLIFWGIKISSISAESCTVSLPFNWQSKNPFSSIYFGAQAGAAELSSGALTLLATQGKDVALLVTGFEAKYLKKASNKTTFVCNEGEKIFTTVQKAIESNQPQKLNVTSIGYNEKGEKVSTFSIQWSFKKRSS